MANRNVLHATPFPAVRHPFEITVGGHPRLPGPYGVSLVGHCGSMIRLDMPGVPTHGLETSRKPDNMGIAFHATAPKKEGFPFDESQRVYAGFVRINQNVLDAPIIEYAENGCFLMIFPQNEGTLLFLPQPRCAPPQISSGSEKSDEGEGSSSGKSTNEVQGILDDINLDAVNLEDSGKSGSPKISSDKSTEGSAKTKQTEGSSSGKSIHKAEGSEKSEYDKDSSEESIHKIEASVKPASGETSSNEFAEGSEKSEYDKDSSEESIHKTQGETSSNEFAEGSVKSGQGESSSAKPVDKAEGSGVATSITSFPNEEDQDWVHAWIKRNILGLDVSEAPKVQPAPAETSSTEQSTHEAPEIEIGSIKECTFHVPWCQCQNCDSYGVCLKTWSTTEDIIGYSNRLKIKGKEGVCEKQVVQVDGRYSLYVRADLPGFEPNLRVTAVRDHCIIVYGKPPSEENYKKGGRSYLLFVKLRCLCCKFDTLLQSLEDGVLRLFCKIIGPERDPSAD